MRVLPGRKLIVTLGGTAGVGWKPAMDLHKIISELQSEKQRLDEAIQALERLSSTAALSPQGKKRGRPRLQKQLPENQKALTAPQGQPAGH